MLKQKFFIDIQRGVISFKVYQIITIEEGYAMNSQLSGVDYMGYSIVELVKNFPFIAHVKDVDTHRYILTNCNNLKLFGFKNENDLLGKNVFDLANVMIDKWPKEYAETINIYDQMVVNTKRAVKVTPDAFLNRDGFVVVHSLTKLPLFDPFENLQAILTLVFDSTKQEKLETLRELYNILYYNRKIGDNKFLQFLGVSAQLAARITKRELDFILSLVRHKTLKEVANDLNISIKGVEALCARLRALMNCYTTSELVSFFVSKLNYNVSS